MYLCQPLYHQIRACSSTLFSILPWRSYDGFSLRRFLVVVFLRTAQYAPTCTIRLTTYARQSRVVMSSSEPEIRVKNTKTANTSRLDVTEHSLHNRVPARRVLLADSSPTDSRLRSTKAQISLVTPRPRTCMVSQYRQHCYLACRKDQRRRRPLCRTCCPLKVSEWDKAYLLNGKSFGTVLRGNARGYK